MRTRTETVETHSSLGRNSFCSLDNLVLVLGQIWGLGRILGLASLLILGLGSFLVLVLGLGSLLVLGLSLVLGSLLGLVLGLGSLLPVLQACSVLRLGGEGGGQLNFLQ